MVKKNPARNRRVHGIELYMECTEEALSPSQITAQQVARYQYDQAIAKIRDAQAKARIGKATIINKVDNVGKVTPQIPQKTTPQKVPSPNQKDTVLIAITQNAQEKRSSSPDIIFVGETPPSKPRPPVQQQQQQQQPHPRSLVVTSRSPAVPTINGQPQQQNVSQQVYKLLSVTPDSRGHQWVMKPVANVMPQQQVVNRISLPQAQQSESAQGELVSGTSGIGYKRPSPTYNTFQQDQSAKKKPKKSNYENEGNVPKRLQESDESGNWVPLDEYYYGKMEGDPTYEEEKNEFRFKCWYCNKMLYNNVKAMMHIQGHIDSSKQQNIDLSDLTQCKHCYKQFDTPFEMQTHVDKVHMSNSNVLLCRICDRDHESRNALTSHMRLHHNACEMPYTCQLCKFRSSMYSDVVDHFKKKHDSSQHLLCLYCLRVFVVKFVSQGWGTTQTYYGHLLKHQSKAQNKKCGLCRLAFFNSHEVKAHKQKHHGPNQKAVLGTAAHSSKPDQVLIKVPASSQSKHCVKSLNAPAVSKVLDFGGTTFPGEVHYYNCFECKMSMGTHDHYRKYVECSMCRFATICSIAYANHMMGFHSGQMSSLNLNIPWERKMGKPMYCLCGFNSRYGNKIANHLVFCMKTSCYENKPEGGFEGQKEEEESDPRHKPGASLLDALGLVKRRTVTPRSEDEVYRKVEENSPPKDETHSSPKSKPSPWEPEYVPPELQGSEKWKTVKLSDPSTPTKESVFIGDGTDKSKTSEGLEDVSMTTDEQIKTRISEKGDNSVSKSSDLDTDEMREENKLLELDDETNCEGDKPDKMRDDENLNVSEEENLLKDENEEKNDKDIVEEREEKSDNDNVEESEEKSNKDNIEESDKDNVEESEEKIDNDNVEESEEKEDSNSCSVAERKGKEKDEDVDENISKDNERVDESDNVNQSENVLADDEKSNENEDVLEDGDSRNKDENETKSENIEKVTESEDNKHLNESDEQKEEVELSQTKDENQSEEKNERFTSQDESGDKEGENVKSSNNELLKDESNLSMSIENKEGSDKQDTTEAGVKKASGEMQESNDTEKYSEGQSDERENTSKPTKQENEGLSKVESSKKSDNREDDRGHHGSRSRDHRSHDDRKSHDDRRSHDKHHYDDRSYHYQGRQDDRNRYRIHDDREYDREYHDNRGYHDNRNYHRDDRRSNNRSSYQGQRGGHSGYGGGGYHGRY